MGVRRIETNAKLSRAVVHNSTVYLCGQTADDRTGGIEQQCRDALAKVDRYLTIAGTDKSRLIYTQIWLRDIVRDFAPMNDVWTAWLPADAAPARATAQCEMAAPDVLVEIIVTAALP
jgi:enamine deaminase RidA (YjgF/YER057c/UK114 family)